MKKSAIILTTMDSKKTFDPINIAYINKYYA